MPVDKRWPIVLLSLFLALDYIENAAFVFSSTYIRGGIGAAVREFMLIIIAYACASMLVILKQSWLAHQLGYGGLMALALSLFTIGVFLVGVVVLYR